MSQYPYAHNLHYALRKLEEALAQEGNLEFLSRQANGNALEFVQTVSKHIDAIEGKSR